jgi:serine/threonine-protein kinase
MAVVYKARDVLLNRIVAVKVLRDQFAEDEEFVRRFRREAQAVAALSHPNIVSIYDVGKEEADFIVMEYVDGKTLKQCIRQEAPFPEKKATELIKQVAAALRHAHNCGIVHRDIKPQNILVTGEGLVKVADFGIAHPISSTTLTPSGDIVGSVHYISPEQGRGEPAQIQSDLYSLGVILFEILTGQLPFDGDSPYTVVMKQIQEEPPTISVLCPGISPDMAEIVGKLLKKSLEQRYQSAGELLVALSRVELSGGLPIETGDPEEPTKIHPGMAAGHLKRKRLRRLSLIGILSIAIILILVLGFSAFWNFVKVPDVVVPDLSGLTKERAAAVLTEQGLVLDANIAYAYSDEVPKDQVVAQSVEAEETVKKGRVVAITLSQGLAKIVMPDVRTERPLQETAISRLVQAGFARDNVAVVQEQSSTVEKGHVINQDPMAGTEWPTDGRVTIWVSSGEAYVMTVMPDVLHISSQDAKLYLNANHFEIVVVTQESTLYPADIVIATDPSPGRAIMQGGKVTMTVSLGPGPSV